MKKIMRFIIVSVGLFAGAGLFAGFMTIFFKWFGLKITPIWILAPLMIIIGAIAPKLIAWAEKTD